MTPVTKPDLLRCHANDSVAVALRSLAAGEVVAIDGQTLAICEDVPQGHKVALLPLEAGADVRKYGAVIGRTTAAIEPGAHVHSHNLATALAGEEHYSTPVAAHAPVAATGSPLGSWQGYRRTDGRVATRNEVWIIPTVGCVGPLADDLAREARARHAGRCDGIFAYSHPHGCSQLGDDLAGTRDVLAGLIDNPNAGGVLLLGLGCESNQLDALLERVPARSRDKIRVVRAQDAGDERERGLAAIVSLVDAIADARREACAAADLSVGLKCGGSDGWSGITANPLLGHFTDRLVGVGGRAILTEIPEIFGAEHDLFARAAEPEIADAAGDLLNRFKRYFLDAGQPVSENPSPGNIAGGITTLEEKSLGAVMKGGRAPLVDVIDYGCQATSAGLTLLEAPGNDAVSSTALAAAGATVILFTTGRGTPLGFPVPTIKVSSNSALAAAKPGWIDFDAGRMIEQDPTSVLDQFCDRLLAIAGGEATAAERANQRAIAIWKRGVTL